MDREKELAQLIYQKAKLIKQCKKEIKIYKYEVDQINEEKRKKRILEKNKKG